MSSFKKLSLLLTLGFVWFLPAGCGSSSPATPPLAPAKPLSQAEESLLKELETLPKDKRSEFVMRHMGEISQYSANNRTFGERMNAATGVSQNGALK